ncbi:MAG: hypothetical protein RLY78_3500 [Pseudomonadota bacterium]
MGVRLRLRLRLPPALSLALPLVLPLALSLTFSPTARAAAAAPLPGSPCPAQPLADAALAEAAVQVLRTLAVQAPGQPADGAWRVQNDAAHESGDAPPWQRISAYPANLALVGMLAAAPQAVRPLAADWLRWQARALAPGRTPWPGVLPDHWLQVDTGRLLRCAPPGAPRPAAARGTRCEAVDAHDSAAASLLLAAQAWWRHTGDASLLREPLLRRALGDAAAALRRLDDGQGLSLAAPDYPVAYLMDAVEVAAGWAAWAQLQAEVWQSPAAAADGRRQARRVASAIQTRLWDAAAGRWRVHARAAAPDATRWYPDTVAQAWPLLWGLDQHLAPPAAEQLRQQARQAWQAAVGGWQAAAPAPAPPPGSVAPAADDPVALRPARWALAPADGDGFWWPSVAVAAACTGDPVSAQIWLGRARAAWLTPAAAPDPDAHPATVMTRFPAPFEIGDLLWLAWLLPPPPPLAPSAAVPAALPPAASLAVPLAPSARSPAAPAAVALTAVPAPGPERHSGEMTR